MLHERGYIVLPNPTEPAVIKAFERSAFKEFERHSRVGMVTEESFAARVEELRKAGAKYVFLKTGARIVRRTSRGRSRSRRNTASTC
jgi:hypothetical protein